MKKTFILLTIAAFMNMGCDWLGRTPVVNECDRCNHCAAGCCLKGECDTEACDCDCKE
tara:strand:+ start:183 stop:356 length:174 start_codon:yes stop_codon:yes gene_type:complete